MRTRRLNVLWKAVQIVGSPPPPPGPPPSGATYQWYSATALADIPFHETVIAGAPAAAVVATNGPNVTGESVVTSLSQFVAAYNLGQRRIVCAESFAVTGDPLNSTAGVDLDIVIPNGINVTGDPLFGATCNRVRIRGETLGNIATAGRIHAPRFGGGKSGHVIFDTMNVTGALSGLGIQVHNGIESLTMVNCRGRSGGAFFIGTSDFTFLGGTSIQAGADSGGGTKWVWRDHSAGTFIMDQCDFRTTNYHVVRIHPSTNSARVIIRRSRLLNNPECQIFVVSAHMGGQSGQARYVGFKNNETYADSSRPSGSLNLHVPANYGGAGGAPANVVLYGDVSDNDIYGGYSDSNIDMSACTSFNRSNRHHAAIADPTTWLGAGNPTSLPIS